MNEEKVRKAMEMFDQVWSEEGGVISHSVENVRRAFKEALAPESRFYKNQQVIVWDDNKGGQYPALLQSIVTEDDCIVSGFESNGEVWQYCKPDPDAESIINWIEHDGKSGITVNITTKCVVIWISKNDISNLEEKAAGTHFRLGDNVARYAIIPLPEYL